MVSQLLPQLAPLSEAAGEASHISPYWYGAFTLVVLVALVVLTVIMGKGRPHS